MSDDNKPKPTLAENLADEAFDDVLFSGDSDDQVPEAAKPTAPRSAAMDELDSFDDVLFSSDDEIAASQAEVDSQPAQIPEVKTTPEPDSSDEMEEFFFADDDNNEPQVPEIKPTKPIDPEPAKLDIPIATPATPPVVKTKRMDSDEFADALFSSDEALEDATDGAVASSQAANKPQSKPEQPEEYADALFSDENELDDALDDAPKAKKVELSIEPEEEFGEALFDSDEALEDALDNPIGEPQEKPQQLAGKAQAEKAENQVSEFDIKTLLTELSQKGQLSENSGQQNSVRLVDRAISGVKALSLFDEKEIDDVAFEAYEHQKIVQEKARLANQQQNVQQGAKAKAKKLFSLAKGGVDELVGADLPERLMPLEFKFVLQKPKKEVTALNGRRDIESFFTKKGMTSPQIMKKADEQLSLLAKTQLPDVDRHRFLDEFYPAVVSGVFELQRRFNRRTLQPNDNEYSVTALHAEGAIKAMISGYKQLFANIYEANNFNYKRQQEDLIELARKLFELLTVEQHFLAATQTAISNISVKTMNKLFMAIYLYEKDALKLRHNVAVYKDALSFSELFIRYQLHLCFDHCKLNSRYNLLLINYLNEHSDFVEVLEYEKLQFMPDTQYIQVSDCFDSRGKYLEGDNIQSEAGQFVYLNCMLLFNRIKNDFKQCYGLLTGEKHQHSDTALKALKLGQVIDFTTVINQAIDSYQNDKRAFPLSAYQSKALGVTTTFAACAELLRNQKLKSLGDAAMAPSTKNKTSKTNITKGVWGEAYRDDKQLFLQAPINTKVPSLEVGLIALVEEEVDGNLQQHICVITRIERVINNMINITLDFVGGESAAIEILGEEEVALGILTSQGDNKLLLQSTGSKVFSGEVLKARFAAQTFFLQQDQLLRIGSDGLVYTLA